jgi:hypothetical protein
MIAERRTQDVVPGKKPARIEGCPGEFKVVEESMKTSRS